jgi:hypothetical protein
VKIQAPTQCSSNDNIMGKTKIGPGPLRDTEISNAAVVELLLQDHQKIEHEIKYEVDDSLDSMLSMNEEDDFFELMEVEGLDEDLANDKQNCEIYSVDDDKDLEVKSEPESEEENSNMQSLVRVGALLEIDDENLM